MTVREVAAKKIGNAFEMVEYLFQKFGKSESLIYFFKELMQSDLKIESAKSKLKVYETVSGLSSFQVILHEPKTLTTKASSCLCMNDLCKHEFDSCSLFKEYDLVVNTLNKVSSQSNSHKEYTPNCEDECSAAGKFVTKDSIVVVAPDKLSDTVWFILIDDVEKTLDDVNQLLMVMKT